MYKYMYMYMCVYVSVYTCVCIHIVSVNILFRTTENVDLYMLLWVEIRYNPAS